MEARVPAEGHPEYEAWVDSCHIYALFHHSNNCTAMRDVEYKGGLWTISNHFFWRTQASALSAFEEAGCELLAADCRAHPCRDVFGNDVESTPDPYLAHVLPTLGLCPEAVKVLELLDALWLKSLATREEFAKENPHLHLLAWSSGAYQLKNLWRANYPEDWEELRAAFKALSDYLRPGVYDFQFLMK